MTRKSTRPAPVGTFDTDWEELARQGQAPALAGRSAEEAQRDRSRTRRIMPTERRRRARKISPTLPEELIDELRDICRELGYVDEDGQGILASEVVRWFLRLAVDAYRSGLIETYEEQVLTSRRGLQWKSAASEG
jgi:hypothetical protein